MKKVVSVLLLALLFSCNKSNLSSPGSYVQYVENPDHGLKKKIDAGPIQYTVQLATPEYMICKELADKNGNIDPEAFRKRTEDLKGYTFFLIKMARKNEHGNIEGTSMAGPANADQMVTYYDQAAAKDISLTIGKEQLSPAVYHFENNYGLSPENTIVAGFKTGDYKSGEIDFIFNDHYTNTPMVKAAYDPETLSQIPTLQIK